MDERWTEIDARAVLEQWRRSGVPLAVFARERGIAAQRLYWWRRKFSFETAHSAGVASAEPLPELLPVRVIKEERMISNEPIELKLRSGHAVVVRAGFDADTLRRVVAALEETGC